MRGAHLVSAASPWLALGLQVTHLALAALLLPPLTVCCGAPKPSLMRGLQAVRPALNSARLVPSRADCTPVLRCGPEGADLQLAELERKHQTLENELSDALAHPSIDDTTIAELKRRKLQVKDEIARLKQDSNTSVH